MLVTLFGARVSPAGFRAVKRCLEGFVDEITQCCLNRPPRAFGRESVVFGFLAADLCR